MLCTGSLEQVDVSALVELHQDRGDDGKAEQPYKTEQIGADKHAHKRYQRIQAYKIRSPMPSGKLPRISMAAAHGMSTVPVPSTGRMSTMAVSSAMSRA